MENLKAPFPYFGGKSAVAAEVWRRLGDVKHYIEPFFGSGAVLLMRRDVVPNMIETANDSDANICNVWRSLQFAPDEVARWCDWPVNHVDLIARKAAIMKNEARLLEGLIADPKWCDPELAGYWIWAACCWIGSGMTGPGAIPHIGSGGMGVHALGKIPHLSGSGMGVHAIGARPHLGTGKGVQEPYKISLYTWFRELSERLRYVRVVCGDWTRVCGGDWQDNGGICGMFFDPPYGAVATRKENLYAQDSLTVAADVQKWCIERGGRPTYRIALAGYYEEHHNLIDHGWDEYRWSASGGYANIGNKQGKINKNKECLWFSPHCLNPEKSLFETITDGGK